MEIWSTFIVPFTDSLPISIVPVVLPSSIDISAPYFRGIMPHRYYNLFDEVIRQSDRLNESEKIK